MDALEGEVCGKPNPTIRDLNEKAIKTLYDLLDNLMDKTDPAMVTAVTDAIAKLNTSLKNSDIIKPEETEEERVAKSQSAILGDMLK